MRTTAAGGAGAAAETHAAPVAEVLDRLLAQVQADEPPMRNSEGRLLKIIEQRFPACTNCATITNTTGGRKRPTWTPDACRRRREPRLHVRDADEIAVLVETAYQADGE